MILKHPAFAPWFVISAFLCVLPTLRAQTLESELQGRSVAELIDGARQLGDTSRGAIVFFQPQMACSKCHVVGSDDTRSLGPDLSALGRDVSDEAIIESVLYPSKVIRKGYESVSVLTVDGKAISALLVEQSPDKLVLRDVARNGEIITIATDDIEEMKYNELSIMPAGQINQLTSQQQFFDLVRYLLEIRDGGAERAKQLQPSPSLLAFSVPEYESQIDHAGLINTWNDAAFERGEAIYKRVCANCHGTYDQPGSLPNSLRFAEGKFKNGSDPLAMYRTLTHGFGLMVPQSWMVPSQKYDVIHYIREAYLHPHNPTQFTAVNDDYLVSLPKGNARGPEPSNIEAWSAMDYGPSLIHTYEIPGLKHNFAYKGIAVRLDPGAGGISRGRHWMTFDTDTLRVAAGWSTSADNSSANNFIDWRAIQFNGEHGVHPKIVGNIVFANSTGPGWGRPGDGSFVDDQRVLGRDGRQYGPLPRQWGQFKGIYHHDQQVILSYRIGSTDVLELPRMTMDDDAPLLLRTFNIGPRSQDLILQVAECSAADAQRIQLDASASSVANLAGFAPHELGAQWSIEEGNLRLRIPAGDEALRFSVWLPSNPSTPSSEAKPSRAATETFQAPSIPDAAIDLNPLIQGGPPRWPQTITTQASLGPDDGPFAVDVLSAPETNPWLALTRFTGLDFYPDGRIAVCSWDGDVWMVTPIEEGNQTSLQWRRIASGLFQPLGLKIVGDKVHLICRDSLTVLHDLNDDGEIDYYQCLNNDHQVTEHFHEFAMGLQTDDKGNFYYAKSGCHGKAAVIPHHGTLLRITPDGSRTDILANGFRAANGVCLNPDGSFVVTDQEGFWNPKNRINWVTLSDSDRPNFYGNMLGYHDVTDTSDAAMVQPLCWITNAVDRSPSELLWVDSERWGPLNGSLLNLSYGYGKVFLVLHENVAGTMQGGMIELPITKFPTGVMRGRFHPSNGQLYLCGMFAWAGNATHPGGFYRVRYTGRPFELPTSLSAHESGMEIAFTEAVDPDSVVDTRNYSIEAWDLKRSAKYGSAHLNQRAWQVTSAQLMSDGKTVRLTVPEISPTWGMEVAYRLKTSAGKPLTGKIHNTIHRLSSEQ